MAYLDAICDENLVFLVDVHFVAGIEPPAAT